MVDKICQDILKLRESGSGDVTLRWTQGDNNNGLLSLEHPYREVASEYTIPTAESEQIVERLRLMPEIEEMATKQHSAGTTEDWTFEIWYKEDKNHSS